MACANLGLDFIGVEKSKEYEIAKKQFREAKAQGCLSFAPPRGGQGGKLTRIRARLGSSPRKTTRSRSAHALKSARAIQGHTQRI